MKIEHDQHHTAPSLNLAPSHHIIMTLFIFAIRFECSNLKSQRFYNKIIQLVSETCVLHDPCTTDLINSANVPGFQLDQDLSQLLCDYNNIATVVVADACNYPLLRNRPHYLMQFGRSITNMFDLPVNGSCVFVLFHDYTTTFLVKQMLNADVTLEPLDPSQVTPTQHKHADDDGDVTTVAYVSFSRFKYIIKTTEQFQYLKIPMQKETILDQFNNADKAYVILQDSKYMSFIRQHVSIHEFKHVLDRAWKYMLQLEHHCKTVHLFDLDCIEGLPLFNMCTDTIASTNTNPYIQVHDAVPIKQSDRQRSVTCNNLICSNATFAKRFKSFLGSKHFDKLTGFVNSNPNMYVTGGIMSLLLNQDQVDASQYDNSDVDVLCVHRNGHEFVDSIKRFLKHANNNKRLECEFNITVTCSTDVEMPYLSLNGIEAIDYSFKKQGYYSYIDRSKKLLKRFTNLHQWFTCTANPAFVENEYNIKQLRKAQSIFDSPTTDQDQPLLNSNDTMLEIIKSIIRDVRYYTDFDYFHETINHLNIVFVKSDQPDAFNMTYHPKIKLTSFGPYKRKVEFFHISSMSSNTMITAANLISSFHLPCVRSYYYQGKIMMSTSAISAYMTNINFNITLYEGMLADDEKNRIITDKYRSRGYTNVLMSNKNK